MDSLTLMAATTTKILQGRCLHQLAALDQEHVVGYCAPAFWIFDTSNSPLSSFGSSVSRRLARVRDSSVLARIWLNSGSMVLANASPISAGGNMNGMRFMFP